MGGVLWARFNIDQNWQMLVIVLVLVLVCGTVVNIAINYLVKFAKKRITKLLQHFTIVPFIWQMIDFSNEIMAHWICKQDFGRQWRCLKSICVLNTENLIKTLTTKCRIFHKIGKWYLDNVTAWNKVFKRAKKKHSLIWS